MCRGRVCTCQEISLPDQLNFQDCIRANFRKRESNYPSKYLQYSRDSSILTTPRFNCGGRGLGCGAGGRAKGSVRWMDSGARPRKERWRNAELGLMNDELGEMG